ncbi:hypothetical protein [Kutzneria sp. 744]|uniref:hypothetical protein n=1 Tax=Kutzneria sp. (strain 744) TaxID=345341 RepID=UPI0004BA8924|nr:hypothetical protein [Kutzneria sp. 744]
MAARVGAVSLESAADTDLTVRSASTEPDCGLVLDEAIVYFVRSTLFHAMSFWPDLIRSCPTRIIGAERSAIVPFADAPEMFGHQLRVVAAVDFRTTCWPRWREPCGAER